jgi:hypothetical protein
LGTANGPDAVIKAGDTYSGTGAVFKDGGSPASSYVWLIGGQNGGGYLILEGTDTYLTAPIAVGGASGVAPKLHFGDNSGSYSFSLKAPDTMVGSVAFTWPGTAGASGQVLATNGTDTLSWTDKDAPSDERLKDIMGESMYGLKDVKGLKPIVFKWKNQKKYDARVHQGFSAQNVEKVMGAAVYQNNEGTKLIEDRALIAMLVNAVKELSAKVDALEKRA